MSSPSQNRGAEWESAAAALLTDAGLQVLSRSYRCRAGELDLVCRDGEQLVIVEVRSRRGLSHGGAAASVDARKQRRIVLAARHYLMTHPGLDSVPIRFDVVAIDRAGDRRPQVRWIRNAFDGA